MIYSTNDFFARKMLSRGVFLICFTLFTSCYGAPNLKKDHSKLPSFVKICHRNDPQLNICARNSFNSLKERFVDGIPELYIPAIEPLIIPEVKMDQNSGAIFLHSTYTNIHVHGLSNFTLKELNLDPVKMKLNLILTFPNVSMEADYKIDGKIMLMPLVGEGVCKASFANVNVNMLITGLKVKKNGRWFIKVKDIKMKYSLTKASINLDNLFNGDKALGNRMNTFLNESWESLSDEIRPLMENAMAEVVRSSTDKLFSKYSFDDLLPE